MRQEEEAESKAISSKKSEYVYEIKPTVSRKKEATPEKRTESSDTNVNTKNTISSASNVTNIDNDNTVIKPASSQVSSESKTSASPPLAPEHPKAVITSIRKETEKAKARFLESDI